MKTNVIFIGRLNEMGKFKSSLLQIVINKIEKALSHLKTKEEESREKED